MRIGIRGNTASEECARNRPGACFQYDSPKCRSCRRVLSQTPFSFILSRRKISSVVSSVSIYRKLSQALVFIFFDFFAKRIFGRVDRDTNAFGFFFGTERYASQMKFRRSPVNIAFPVMIGRSSNLYRELCGIRFIDSRDELLERQNFFWRYSSSAGVRSMLFFMMIFMFLYGFSYLTIETSRSGYFVGRTIWISGSSRRPNFRYTLAWISAMRDITSFAVAPPVFTMKFVCFLEIVAPPRRTPARPLSPMSLAAAMTGTGSVYGEGRIAVVQGKIFYGVTIWFAPRRKYIGERNIFKNAAGAGIFKRMMRRAPRLFFTERRSDLFF